MMVALEGVPYRLAKPRATKPDIKSVPGTPAAGYAGRSSIISGELQTVGGSYMFFEPQMELANRLVPISQGPKKLGNSRAQPPPTSPRNVYAPIQNIMHGAV
jgi:hypothetical protein